MSDDKTKQYPHNKGSWLVLCRTDEGITIEGYSVSLRGSQTTYQGIHEGDGFLVSMEVDGRYMVVGVGHVYRKQAMDDRVTFYFDAYREIDPAIELESLEISIPESEPAISRLKWDDYARIVNQVTGDSPEKLPPIEDRAYIRELLQHAVVDDLLGPANGPHEEVVGMSVRDRYLVGKLAPREVQIGGDQIEELPTGGTNDVEDGGQEIDVSTNQSLVPSSFGLTVCVDGETKSLEVEARWGRYERGESEEKINEETGKPLRAWKRIPSGGKVVLALNEGAIEPTVVDSECPEVVVQGTVRQKLATGDRLVTLFLVNAQTQPEQNQDGAWVFQPELILRHPEGEPIFRRRPVLEADGKDDERESLEMIYRKHVEFAVGHGISIHADPVADSEKSAEIRTAVVPRYEVPVTETPGLDDDDRPALRRMIEDGYLDMERLASMDRAELTSALRVLTDDYGAWIDEQANRIGKDVEGYDLAANEAIANCREILDRLQEGVDVLESDDRALQAFRFANQAMALQRTHSIYSLKRRRGEEVTLDELNQPGNRSWRPFQLAFVLLSIPALADPGHRDRTEPLQAYADLLWFPTGGGKTEAYLGVAAFTMGIRRLQGDLGGLDAGRGLAVIMRYTLRLLTLQQFQRATTLICAMEVLRRRKETVWGEEPFTIGLWVGQKVTPNTTEESHAAIEREREKKWGGSGSTPSQLTSCPWCGEEIVPGRDIKVDKDIGRTLIYCGDKLGRCDFSRTKSTDSGLPVNVVDEEIYHRPPSMLIATVDKFAMMAWRGKVRTLFGKATQECERHGLLWPEADCTGKHPKKGVLPPTKVRDISPIRPPDLIIQDEFHLISGPLGTMVGLYETAVDELSTWQIDGKSIRPKVIASTATVRKAQEQVKHVFLRQVSVFPPHGLDVEDNFFSVQRPIDDKPGRRYLGICSPGSSRPAVLIRLYVALLTAARELYERFGAPADPYMTVVGYFNSLRELGGMRRLAEDDVQTRSYRVQMSQVTRPGLAQRSVRQIDELTSRVSSKDIPKKLDQLEVSFKDEWEKGETRAIDIVLATNMLSVGVDVNRLGLMVVNGQPKGTAEYIQATSRVGRSFPGLVCTVLTWARPRDLSHYETFEHYHATFYKHVEAQSVTPFSPRAMDRGLTGAMVSLLRLENDEMNPNRGASMLDSASKPEVDRVRKEISDRAWKVTDRSEIKHDAETMFAERIDQWVKEASKGGRVLGYEKERKKKKGQDKGVVAGLLRKPGLQSWDDFTVPMSMREVEPGVRLIMDTGRLGDGPDWRVMPKVEDGDGGDS